MCVCVCGRCAGVPACHVASRCVHLGFCLFVRHAPVCRRDTKTCYLTNMIEMFTVFFIILFKVIRVLCALVCGCGTEAESDSACVFAMHTVSLRQLFDSVDSGLHY